MIAFALSMVSEVTTGKNSKQTLPYVEKVTVQKLIIGFLTITSNHKVKHWAPADLLLIKNIMLDGFY